MYSGGESECDRSVKSSHSCRQWPETKDDFRLQARQLLPECSRFKCDDVRTIRDLFEVGDYLFKFDIKSGCHHIDILEAHGSLMERLLFCLYSLSFWPCYCSIVLHRLYVY